MTRLDEIENGEMSEMDLKTLITALTQKAREDFQKCSDRARAALAETEEGGG